MRNRDFTHLHLHTDKGSLLDGVGQVKQYVVKAKKMKFKHLGISDHGSIDAVVDFENECRTNDISPVIGSEFYVSCDDDWKGRRKHMCLFVKNETGWNNLTKMLSYASLDTFYRKPIVELGTIYDNCEGLIITTACVGSWLYLDSGMDFFEEVRKKIGDDLYLEIMPHSHQLQYDVNKFCLDLSKKFDVNMITTADVHYVNKEDVILQDVLLAVNGKRTWSDPKRFSLDFRDLYLMSTKEMLSMYKNQDIISIEDAEQSMRNTMLIAKKCEDFTIPKQEISLPVVKKYEKLTVAENIKKICKKNFKEKFGKSLKRNKIYKDRFEEELRVITSKKFENYFMIAWDFLNKCREVGIEIGPGRGSVSGSLLCYLLKITKVDPLKHKLLFERFLNEDRGDWPDIDMDIEKARIEDSKKILEETYGKYNVAGVTNYVAMKGKGALRDVSRVFEVPLELVNMVSKEMGDEFTLEQALEETESGRHFKRHYSKVSNIALRLEGTIRSASQHAAAVIISKTDLRESGQCALVRRNKKILVNWEMKNSEEMGLMKLDVLSLSNLSITRETKELVKNAHGITLKDDVLLGLKDKAVYEDISIGKTSGIFQFNTYSMTALSKELKVDSFELMSAAQALVRPGPADSGITAEFIKRRHGKSWEPMHPIYEKITKETFSQIIYQEQIMRMFTEMADCPSLLLIKSERLLVKKEMLVNLSSTNKCSLMVAKRWEHWMRKELMNSGWCLKRMPTILSTRVIVLAILTFLMRLPI